MLTSEIIDQFQPEFRTVFSYLGSADDFSRTTSLVSPISSRNYQLHLARPNREIGFSVPSKVVMTDIKKDPQTEVASFVVRNDNKYYQQLRDLAEKNPS